MTLDGLENTLIESFIFQVKNGKYESKVEILKDPNAKALYDEYINSVIALNPKEYKMKDVIQLSEREFTTLLLEVINRIYGNNYMLDFNDVLEHKIVTNNSDDIFDGVNYNVFEKDGVTKVGSYIVVPNFTHISSIVTLLHEFTHYIVNKYNVSLNGKYYYNELLSIYVEKRVLEIMKEIRIKNSNKEIESTRLESIKWHYKDHKEEVGAVRDIANNLKRAAQYDVVAKQQLEDLYGDFPSLRDNFKYVFNYYNNLAASYGIGYLYSESLLNKYKEDNKKMDELFNDIIKGNKKIEEVLTYYGISVNNQDVYDTVNKKIRLLK